MMSSSSVSAITPVSSKQKPVVLHIVYSGLGGIASVFFSLVEAAGGDDYEHVVAFYGVEKLVDDYRDHCEHLGIKQRFFHRRPRIDLRVNRALYSWIEELSPVAILVNLPRALKPAVDYQNKHRSVKVIGVEHNSNALKRVIEWRDSAQYCRYCTDVVYLTRAYRKQVAQRLGKAFNKSKTSIIPNGINTDKFVPRAPFQRVHSKAAAGKPEIRIGMASRLTDSKDIATLIESMVSVQAASPDAQLTLTIAGDGPDHKNLIQQVKKYKLENVVCFEGFLTESELIEWLQSLDIYAHATLAETMSTAIMQALASGLPCVASKLAGMDELVIPSTGFIVEPKNPDQLADALASLINNASLRQTMAQAARAHAVENLSQNVTWQRYKQLIES